MITGYAEIPTVSSSLEQISKTVEKLPIDEIATRVEHALEGMENWINSPELKEIVTSMNQTMKHIESTTQSINDQTKPLLAEIEKTVAETQGLVRDLRAQVNPWQRMRRRSPRGRGNWLATMNTSPPRACLQYGENAGCGAAALKKAEAAFGGMEGAVGEDSRLRFELSNTLKELTTAARSMRTLADYLDRHPEALLRGKGGDRGK